MRKPHFRFASTVSLLNELNRDVPRLLGYDEAGGKQNFKTWQAKARKKLRGLLGFLPVKVTDPKSWLLETEQREGFTREQWALESPLGDHILLYRLVPRLAKGPKGILLALHGHGLYGADFVAGVNLGRPGEQEMLDQCNYDYGVQFAERGWLVYAPCQRGFNQRNDQGIPFKDVLPGQVIDPNDPSAPTGCSCLDINSRAILLGTTDIGLRVQDAVHLVSWIKSRPEERKLPLGCVGLSGGGHTTELLAAVDTRIKAASIQGYFCYWSDQIMDVTHCNCNYVPHLLRYFEQDDVCGLICPRPLLVTTATEDGVAPVKSFRKAYRALKQTYRDQGVEKNLDQDIFEGEHEFSGRKAFKFFDKHLATGLLA